MASQDASAEDFKAAKYSLQNVSFRSIKRARDMFLADHGAMPPQQALSDEEIAAVVTYVFGLNHVTAELKATDVARVRSEAATNLDVKRLRLDLAK